MRVLRAARVPTCLLVDVALDIRDLVMRLEANTFNVPIVACGISNDARAAVAAIHAAPSDTSRCSLRSGIDRRGCFAAVANESHATWSYRRRSDGQGDQAGPTDRWLRRLGHDHRRIRTGKEVLARYVHTRSNLRQAAVHISINCAAIPETCLSPNCSAMRRGAFHRRHREAYRQIRQKPPAALAARTKSPR